MASVARYDRVVEFYAGEIGEAADPATAALLEVAGDVRGLRVLDVACGSGRATRELARRGARVTGVDISAGMLARAREAEQREPLGIGYVLGGIPAGRYDAVVCNWGLSDIDDLDGVLDAVAGALEPGGFFVCSLLHPCFPGIGERIPSSWPPGSGYYAEGWWATDSVSSPIRRRVGANHRTLASYLNALIVRGLAITCVREPAPPATWLAGDQAVPAYLVLSANRTG